jgi:uncharacterized membrane-anchored protein
MKRIFLSATLMLVTLASLLAKDPPDSLQLLIDARLKQIDSVESTLHYQTGKISLGKGIAEINVPATFRYLGPQEAQYVIEDLWGNPHGETPLGLLLPADVRATDAGGYAFIIQYEDIGYVKDGDADKIDYDDLLKDLKESSKKENVERKKLNIFTMDLVGWAARPYYDKEKKVLHWAKEYSIPGQESNTLNYDIRILGRKGILTLQAVSDISELDSVNNHIGEVLSMVSFSKGNRYAEFDSDTDNVAAWTIGGLVAGKVLAKAGFFAVILKFGKFILIGLTIAGGAIWRFITGRRKKEEEFVYEPQPVVEETPSQQQS